MRTTKGTAAQLLTVEAFCALPEGTVVLANNGRMYRLWGGSDVCLSGEGRWMAQHVLSVDPLQVGPDGRATRTLSERHIVKVIR